MMDPSESRDEEKSSVTRDAPSSGETKRWEATALLESLGELLQELLLRVEREMQEAGEPAPHSWDERAPVTPRPGPVTELATPAPEALFGPSEVMRFPSSVLNDPEEFLKAIDFMTRYGERDDPPDPDLEDPDRKERPVGARASLPRV